MVAEAALIGGPFICSFVRVEAEGGVLTIIKLHLRLPPTRTATKRRRRSGVLLGHAAITRRIDVHYGVVIGVQTAPSMAMKDEESWFDGPPRRLNSAI